jgi:hypothetical protein
MVDTLKDTLMVIATPQPKTVSVSSRAEFTVGATGNGLKYQWQMSKDGGLSWQNSSSDGYNTPKLSFVVSEAAHGRMFRCVVTDQNGDSIESEGAVVMVDSLKDTLMIIAQPQDTVAAPSQRAAFSVGAAGNGLKFQWQMSRDGGLTWANSQSDGYNTARLSFVNSDAVNGRMFRCIVTDQNGDQIISEGAAVLSSNLTDNLLVYAQPKDSTVNAGDRASFSVRATGTGLKYQWQMSKDGGNTWTNSTSDGYNTATVSFNTTTAVSGRMFRCVVTDANGQTATSAGATITVK